MGEMRNAYTIFLGIPQGKMPLGRPRHEWKDVRMDLRKIVCEGVDWINLVQDGGQWIVVSTVMNLRFP
jgi:hypothetical protein